MSKIRVSKAEMNYFHEHGTSAGYVKPVKAKKLKPVVSMDTYQFSFSHGTATEGGKMVFILQEGKTVEAGAVLKKIAEYMRLTPESTLTIERIGA
jgi:hypothetical protein